MRCEEIMTMEVEVVGRADTVTEAARKMRDLNIGFLPVCDRHGNVEGVLTDRDLAVRVVAEEREPETRVDEVMTVEVVSCHPEDELGKVERLMRANQKSRVVCIDETGRLAGVISLADLAQYADARRTGELLSDVLERETVPH